jgi:hypothetical protein
VSASLVYAYVERKQISTLTHDGPRDQVPDFGTGEVAPKRLVLNSFTAAEFPVSIQNPSADRDRGAELPEARHGHHFLS